MIVEHCEFPDDLLYDYDGNTWVRIEDSGKTARIGLTSLLASLAGRLSTLNIRPAGNLVTRGRSLGTVESSRMVGPIPSPLSGRIIETNEALTTTPKVLNNYPYSDGWIVRLEPSNLNGERGRLLTTSLLGDLVRQRILEFHVRCFKLFPDHELYEVGSECAAVLVRLNELIGRVPVGDVIHVVSDDPTAYVEMVVWSEKTGNDLVEWRKEESLNHFIITKRSDAAQGLHR